MLVTTVASLALIVTVHQPASPHPDRVVSATQQTFAHHDTLLGSRGSAQLLDQARSADDHLDSARRAMKNGDFDIARREFRASAALSRAAGKLPLEAVLGLAEALYAQSYNREAATTLEALAAEASLRGDNNVEALALADALWLNAEAGQHTTVRKQRTRLRNLMKDAVLTPDVQRAVRARVG
jgi:hypothetical protein